MSLERRRPGCATPSGPGAAQPAGSCFRTGGATACGSNGGFAIRQCGGAARFLASSARFCRWYGRQFRQGCL